ncbi:MAG: NAD-dependent epimerase/dehydratase family protein [Bacteroidales bacterium]|nr:NAD-dependent epimerase/dehydratase family protein [Bacteroidales bacterium]
MKILVLGGNGFIGSHLVDKLLLKGHSVRVFDKNDEHYRKRLNGVEYHVGEFGNRGVLSDALNGIDVVVHLICTTLPKTSNDDPVFDMQSNVIETLFLLEQCRANNIKKIIFASSGGTIYGIPQVLPVQEDDQTNPICSYGIGKLTIEKYLYLFKKLHGLDFVIIRPSNPFGPRQNPLGIQGVIPVFLGKILRNEPIQIWGTGDIVRDYIYIDDLVDAFYHVVVTKTMSTIYNIGSGNGHSLNDLLSIMKKVTKSDFSITYTTARSYDVPEIYLDINRASKELNWEPQITLEQGIQSTWDFIKSLSVQKE